MKRRGCLYWGTVDKRRPVLVVSVDARNERASDIIVVPCSTRILDAPTHVRLGRSEGGLSRPCVLKCEQITTVATAEVDDVPLGAPLSQARMREVERAVARAIGVPA
jgi:mRNA-degrading endonuclease toxin of MazEF toxin-antitoxin module